MKVLSNRLALLLSVVLLLCSSAGCRNDNVAKSGGEKTDSNLLAMVGDGQITKEDLEATLNRVPEKKRQTLKRSKVLDDLIWAKVFAAEARSAGLEDDPRVKEDLEKAKKETLARHFVKKHIDKEAEPSEEELEPYYREHLDQFVIPEGVLIQHIVVKKKEEADAVLKALEDGASFEELAKEKSICRCWNKGGNHGWQYKGWLEPALEKVAFGLEKGKLSDIVETKEGYQVIQVLDKKDRTQISFKEAKARIRSKLFSERKKELVDQYYEMAGVNRDPAEDGVLAKIGEKEITKETLAPMLDKFSQKETDRAAERWINYLVETEVFSVEAAKVQLEKDPEVKRELKRKTEHILAKAFHTKHVRDKLQVDDRDVRLYYQAHPEEFRMPVRVRVKSILVKTKKEAQDILKELEKGASFGHLAVEHSLHPLASRRGGEIGWFAEGERDPAVERVAFILEKGQRSDIIKTQAGYEIIKLMDKKGGGVSPFPQVKQAIKMNLHKQRYEEEKQRYYQKAGVKIFGS